MEYYEEDDLDLCASGPAKIDRIYRQMEIVLKKPSKLAICVKWFITILCSCMLLICVILSKFAVIELASVMYNNGTCTGADLSHAGDCQSSFILLVIVLLTPNVINFVRFSWTSICNDKREWPNQAKLLMCVCLSIIEALGLCTFTFKLLTTERNELLILLMDCVFIGHIMATVLMECTTTNSDEDISHNLLRCARIGISLISVMAGTVLTLYITFTSLTDKTDFLFVCISIFCLSISWLPWLQRQIIQTMSMEQYNVEINAASLHVPDEQANDDNADATPNTENQKKSDSLACSLSSNYQTGGPKTEEAREICTHKIVIISSFTKILTIIIYASILERVELNFNTHSIQIFKKLMIQEIDLTSDLGRQKLYTVFNVTFSFLGYIIGIYALKTQMHVLGFVLPLLLSTPISFIMLYVPNLCSDFNFSNGTEIFMGTICVNDTQRDDISILLAALFLLWIAQLLSTGCYVLGSPACILQHEVKLFWIPLYNSILLDQWMLLDRRTIFLDSHHLHTKDRRKRTKVYICTTMYRETREEMKQLLESIARINEAKQYGSRDFESHIIVDGGIKNEVCGEKALQLLSLVIEVLKTNGLGTIAATPYGLRLTWSLRPLNGERCNRPMTFVIHLKDSKKVKNKKRWSQVMYMSYILDYLLKQDNTVVEEDAFILTTDADVKFSPDSVEALLDLMTRDTSVGAVCARTYPLGTGPLLWYQQFEYAIGHWLQKTAEHVMGTVLCAPGCFSVYRITAVRDILPIYATDVERGLEFLTKDMGEDRWMCTLLVQSGWRIDYCAASCNHTNCPVEFDEFFTQRRRWIGSTIANSYLLLKEWNIVKKVNQDLSVWYLVYQSCLMGSTLLGPSTVMLIVSSGLSYVWSLDMVLLTCVQAVVVSLFCVVCLKTTKETQHLVAKVLTGIYVFLMVFVVIGTVEGTIENISKFHMTQRDTGNSTEHDNVTTTASTPPPTKDSAVSITTVYVLGLVTFFPIAGLIHLSEVTCLLKGVVYLLCLPSTYILLIIYSFCNITDRSWGTRDKQKENTVKSDSWYKSLGTELKSIFNQYHRLTEDKNQTDKQDSKKEQESSIPQEKSSENNETKTTSEQPCEKKTMSEIASKNTATREIADLQESELPGNEQSLIFNYPQCPVTSENESSDVEGNLLNVTEPTEKTFQSFISSKKGTQYITIEDWIGQADLVPLFKKLGYDDTSFIATLTESDLERIGIRERTQRNLLVRRIGELNQFSFSASIPDDVYTWLRYIRLEQYTEQFTKCHITTPEDLEQLTSFTRKDIETELKITKPAHIKRLLDAIAYLRSPTKEEKINTKIKHKLTNAPKYAIEMISPEDYSYWNRLIDHFLKPTSDGFSIEWTLKTELIELRNVWLFILFVVNALWLILILTVALKIDLIIFGSSPVAFIFFVIFGLLLLVQFICMILHRLSTLAHFLARTPYRFGDKYQSSWSYTCDDDIEALAEVKKSVEDCRRLERLLIEKVDRNDHIGPNENTPLMRRTYSIDQ